MNIREKTEAIERQILSPYACLAENSKGRERDEAQCALRTVFQRDRDRIIHSKAFRRLKHKTQVFITPEGDHYRTRLTHTLEVAQIARTMARALRLNEDLTEAISLGHDLGHTPFGHAGERALAEICPLGFRHNLQSLRVVECLEDNRGLNLTAEVRDGIANHTSSGNAMTLEGQLVSLADRFAYINHDIDDALRGSIIAFSDLPAEPLRLLGSTHSGRINTLITDVIQSSEGKDTVAMSDEVRGAMDELRRFMFKNVYIDSVAKTDEAKAQHMLRELYLYFKNNPEDLPDDERVRAASEGLDIVVCDYIAGMTDRYAIYTFSRHFVPRSWQMR